MKNNIYSSDLVIDYFDSENASFLNLDSRVSVSDKNKNFTKTSVHLQADNEFGKPEGEYITYELKDEFSFSKELIDGLVLDFEKLFKNKNNILFVGVGNDNLVSDSLGPAVISRLDPPSNYKRKVSKISPNVCGNTGIESNELVKLAISLVSPDLVVVIDSLASRNFNRIGRSFQISTGGISPGSGSGKHSPFELSKSTLGVPVIAVGVPIVVHFKSYLFELVSLMKLKEKCQAHAYQFIGSEEGLRGVILAPKEVDAIVDFSSRVIASALNSVLLK